ncbi:TPA: hypothetical protein P5S08_003356 [Salmonella enterica subsp. enterica serovar Concord]|nr:hypothetical protein [Salmonella enterica subsp. enterica serovar Concord]
MQKGNSTFLVQNGGHATAKPPAMQAAARHLKGAVSQQGIRQPEASGKTRGPARDGHYVVL